MYSRTLRIATRKSPLALWQANHIRDELLQKWPGLKIELVPMTTSGDRFLKDKLLVVGGKGLFVKELEEALFDKRADIAVHSAKDMPAQFPDGLSLAAICKRASPYDAFISKDYSALSELPHGAIVGTGSLRRQSQLLAYRPDLFIKTLRGNINTRLAKLDSGDYQAIILAAAGLERMDMNQCIKEKLSEDIMLPACGQGALAIECRTEDQEIKDLIMPLNDPLSSVCVLAERQVNALLGGNCHVPLAVFCRITPSNLLLLQAKILNHDGSQIIYTHQTGAQEEYSNLAQLCSESLLEQGAAELLASIPK